MTEKGNIFTKLGNIDKRILYAGMILLNAITLIVPLGLPVVIDPVTKAAYDSIEAIPEGSLVLIAYDVVAGTYPEIKPGQVAVIKHIIMRKLKFVVVSVQPEAVPLVTSLMEELKTDLDEYQYKYGEDYVWLGFFSGEKSACISLATNFNEVATIDAYGNTADELPLIQGITGIDDFYTGACVFSGGETLSWWMETWGATYGAKFITTQTAKTAAGAVPYYLSGDLVGIVGGMSGGAQYENLIRRIGPASMQNDMVSLAVILNIIYLLIGNIAHYGSKGGAS